MAGLGNAAYQREWRLAHPESVRAARRRYLNANREKVLAGRRRRYRKNPEPFLRRMSARASANQAYIWALKDKPCADCGKKYPPWVMDFDHREGEVKLFDVARGRQMSRERVDLEAAKCDLVCSNCHRDRTYRRCQK